MVRSYLWLVLLFLQPLHADKGKGGSAVTGGSSVVSTFSSTSTNDVGTVVPTSSPIASPTHSSVVPSSTHSSPVITFLAPSNATTCMPVTFQWHVLSPSTNITMDMYLQITNNGVPQAAPSNSSPPSVTSVATQPGRRQLPTFEISRDITNQTAMSTGSFNWSAVNVPPGWYILEASPIPTNGGEPVTLSARFFIMEGSNTTCVYPGVLPPTTSPSHSHLSSGALAGTVVGTVIGVTVLLGAFVLPRLWRRGVPGHQAWKHKHGGLYRLF
ncbi:hypothetical protein K439DRAFT_91959 [Ramaria rubella]|nr:hypothetical protein K439DRAFT_91959 [Ramaria rubella]